MKMCLEYRKTGVSLIQQLILTSLSDMIYDCEIWKIPMDESTVFNMGIGFMMAVDKKTWTPYEPVEGNS